MDWQKARMKWINVVWKLLEHEQKSREERSEWNAPVFFFSPEGHRPLADQSSDSAGSELTKRAREDSIGMFSLVVISLLGVFPPWSGYFVWPYPSRDLSYPPRPSYPLNELVTWSQHRGLGLPSNATSHEEINLHISAVQSQDSFLLRMYGITEVRNTDPKHYKQQQVS
jgi:hypothetical protein